MDRASGIIASITVNGNDFAARRSATYNLFWQHARWRQRCDVKSCEPPGNAGARIESTKTAAPRSEWLTRESVQLLFVAKACHWIGAKLSGNDLLAVTTEIDFTLSSIQISICVSGLCPWSKLVATLPSLPATSDPPGAVDNELT